MNQWLETTLFELSKLFLTPVLLLIALLFAYALFTVGGFIAEGWLRRRGSALRRYHAAYPGLASEDLELWIVKKLELLRIASRTAPMLGLVATMIPMGPALLSLSDGKMDGVGENLAVAFSAVITALVSASLTFWVLTVRRRWMLSDLREIERGRAERQV